MILKTFKTTKKGWQIQYINCDLQPNTINTERMVEEIANKFYELADYVKEFFTLESIGLSGVTLKHGKITKIAFSFGTFLNEEPVTVSREDIFYRPEQSEIDQQEAELKYRKAEKLGIFQAVYDTVKEIDRMIEENLPVLLDMAKGDQNQLKLTYERHEDNDEESAAAQEYEHEQAEF